MSEPSRTDAPAVRRPGGRRWLLPALIGVIVLGAGAVLAVATRPLCACSPSPPPDEAEGIVIAVQSTGLSAVHGFTLRTASGDTIEFAFTDRYETSTTFPPGHLAEHQATSAPVRVVFRVENGQRVVYRLEDAVPSPAPSSLPS